MSGSVLCSITRQKYLTSLSPDVDKIILDSRCFKLSFILKPEMQIFGVQVDLRTGYIFRMMYYIVFLIYMTLFL